MTAAAALVELWLRTAGVTAAALAVVFVLYRLRRRFRLEFRSPVRAYRRAVIRTRWASVARSSGLAVAKDKRKITRGGGLGNLDLVALVSGPVDQKRPASATKSTTSTEAVERLPRISRGRASPDRLTVTYRLRPARGQTVEDVAALVDKLRDGLNVNRVAVYRTGNNRGELVAYFGDPFHLPRLWQPTPMRNALVWGHDEHGKAVALRLGQGHALYAAETGGGKSYVLNALLASATVRPDVAIIGVDLKRVELAPFAERLSGLAVDPAHAAAVIAAVAEEVHRRYARLEAAGLRKMTEATPELGPWLLVVIDELSELLDVIDRGDLVSIGRLSRACGITLAVATQRPDAQTLSSNLRDQLALQRWCGHVASPETARMVVGAGCALDPTTIEVKGAGVLLDEGAKARIARSDVLGTGPTDELAEAAIAARVAELMAEHATKRIPLDWLPEAPTQNVRKAA